MTANPRFELRLMGNFGFRRSGGGPDIAIGSKKARALLAYLAMQDPMRGSREQLATLLWPDRVDRMTRQNLRACIASLRRDLGGCADAVLTTDDETVALNDCLDVDARALRRLSKAGATADLEDAALLCRGQFLSDLTLEGEQFREWALAERAQLDAAAGTILATLASRADAAGDGANAIEFSSRLLAIDPFREDWLRLALRISARHLGRDKALLQARNFAALLKKELDVEPDADTLALIERIKTGNGGSAGGRIEDGHQSLLHQRLLHQSLLHESPVPAPALQPVFQPVLQPSLHREALPQSLATRQNRRWPVAARVATVVFVIASLVAVYETGQRGAWPWLFPAGQAVADRSAIPLVVAPFQSQTPDTAVLARDLTANVLASLSRFSGLTVVDGRSAAAERDRSDGGIGSGSRFLAWGSVHRQDTLIRVSVGLTDTASHTVLWADDYAVDDGQAADLTGKIPPRIARAFQIQATYALARELDESKLDRAPLNQLVAKALTIQYRSPTPADEAPAVALYREVLRRDHDNPLALIGLAARLVMSGANMQSVEKASLGRAQLLIQRALRSDPRIERAYYWLGNIYLARGERDLALHSFERALELNPSFIPAEAHVGYALVLSGRADDGLRHIQNALAESSHDPTERLWLRFAGIAQIELGDDQAAIRSLQQAASLAAPSPTLRAALASVYALAGQHARSREQFRLMKEAADPAALQRLLDRAAKSDPSQGSRYLQGLHLAANDAL